MDVIMVIIETPGFYPKAMMVDVKYREILLKTSQLYAYISSGDNPFIRRTYPQAYLRDAFYWSPSGHVFDHTPTQVKNMLMTRNRFKKGKQIFNVVERYMSTDIG